MSTDLSPNFILGLVDVTSESETGPESKRGSDAGKTGVDAGGRAEVRRDPSARSYKSRVWYPPGPCPV